MYVNIGNVETTVPVIWCISLQLRAIESATLSTLSVWGKVAFLVCGFFPKLGFFTDFLYHYHYHYHIIYLSRRQRHRMARDDGWRGARSALCRVLSKTGARSSRITVSAELEWPGALCSAHMLNYFKRTARCFKVNSWDGGGGGGVLGNSRFPWECNSGKIMKHSGNQWSFYWNTYRVTRVTLFCVLGHSGE
jgi:hypothetical protein